jgi:hypothetical protein
MLQWGGVTAEDVKTKNEEDNTDYWLIQLHLLCTIN